MFDQEEQKMLIADNGNPPFVVPFAQQLEVIVE